MASEELYPYRYVVSEWWTVLFVSIKILPNDLSFFWNNTTNKNIVIVEIITMEQAIKKQNYKRSLLAQVDDGFESVE